MTKPDGRYPGKIVHAYLAEDVFDAGKYVLQLNVNLDGGGAVTCRQPIKNDEYERRDQVLKALGLTYPFTSKELAELDGKGIEVNLKTSPKGKQNAYVATVREGRVLTAEEIDALMADAQTAINSDVPF